MSLRELRRVEVLARVKCRERARRAQPRHPSGPTDQDDTEEDWDAGAGQRVFAAGISTRAQPALPAGGSGGGRLSPAGAESGPVAGDLPAGERANNQQRLVRYDNRWFQVQAQSRKYAPAQGKVVVCEWQDGRIEIEYRGRKLPWKEILGTVPQVSAELKPSPLLQVAACATS
jgi:hypothetical protein